MYGWNGIEKTILFTFLLMLFGRKEFNAVFLSFFATIFVANSTEKSVQKVSISSFFFFFF